MAPPTTVMEAVKLSETYLSRNGVDSPRLSAEHLLAKALECSRLDLYLRYGESLGEDVLGRYRKDLKKRASHYPLQYILGRVEFCSLAFKVKEGVFIPRPETELLVEWIEELLDAEKAVRFVELGVGAGVISGTIARRNTLWSGAAFDISREAVELAGENFAALGVEERVEVFVADRFDIVKGRGSYDLLVSNPPYIPSGGIDALQQEVSRYEAREALDGGGDGMVFYPLLAGAGKEFLKPGGLLALEIGDGQAAGVTVMLEKSGYTSVSMRKDYNGLERMVTAFRPGEEGGP